MAPLAPSYGLHYFIKINLIFFPKGESMQIASTFICDSRGSNFKFKRTQLTKILGVSQSSAPPPLFLLILSIDDIESWSCANRVLNVLSALSDLSSSHRFTEVATFYR